MTTLKELYNKADVKVEVSEHTAEGVSLARENIHKTKNVPAALFIAAKDIDHYVNYGNNIDPSLKGGQTKTAVATEEFELYFDLNHKKEKIDQGEIGTMFGMPVFTDAYFSPEKRFITHTYAGNITNSFMGLGV